MMVESNQVAENPCISLPTKHAVHAGLEDKTLHMTCSAKVPHSPDLVPTTLSASPLHLLPVLTEKELPGPPHLFELRDRTRKDMALLMFNQAAPCRQCRQDSHQKHIKNILLRCLPQDWCVTGHPACLQHASCCPSYVTARRKSTGDCTCPYNYMKKLPTSTCT